MVTTQDGNPVSVAHLQCNQERHCLNRVVATVNIVPHEQVVGVGRLAADLEELHEVVELTVHIAANGYRAFDRLKNRNRLQIKQILLVSTFL